MGEINLYIATTDEGTVITANTTFELCEIFVKDYFGINSNINYVNPAIYDGFLKNIYEDENGGVVEPEDNACIGKWLFTDSIGDEPVKHAINVYKILVDKEV